MKNVSIGLKLILTFSVICMMFAGTGVFITLSSNTVTELADDVNNEILPHTMNFIEIKKDIIQIQQWLTDISATRAHEGYDDGFREAEKYYKDVVSRLDFAIKEHEKYGEVEMVEKLEEMNNSLAGYYGMGKKMAQAYIDGGPEKGNPMMDQFDPFAEKIAGIIDVLVDEHQKELRQAFTEIKTHNGRTHTITVVSVVLTLMFSACIALLMIRDIRKRTLQINDAFAQSAKGDLSVFIKNSHQDEIGKIAQGFNLFIKELNGIIQRVKEDAAKLSDASRNLSKDSDQMNLATEESSSKAHAVTRSAGEMSSSIDTVAASIEQASGNINTIASASEEMTATIDEIAKNSEQAISIINDAVSQTETASVQVNALSDAAHEIGNVVETINDISEQVNLLALNATIEAARAGEAGKGFAVVANEIKDLATQTASATNEIKERVNKIQDSTSNTVLNITNVSDGINQINGIVATVASAVEEQSATSKEIAENISQTAMGLGQINENIIQGANASHQVQNDISDISDASGEMTGYSSDVNHRSEALAELAEGLDSLVAKFKA